MTQDPYAACADLRFAEGLRRRAEEARAEATIREATSLALLEGARVARQVLRTDVMGGATCVPSPDRAIALGNWRASWSLISALPDLNPRSTTVRSQVFPWRQLLARWHKDLGFYRVQAGLCRSQEVGIPLRPQAINSLVVTLEGAKGIEGAAAAWKYLASTPVFSFGNDVLGFLAAKQILAQSGVEPTAVAVVSHMASQNQARYRDLVRNGSDSDWVTFLVESLILGVEQGKQIARLVQAGRTH